MIQALLLIGAAALAVAAFLAGLFLSRYLPAYFGEKGKNLATKEDVAEITRKVEEVKDRFNVGLERIRTDLRMEAAEHETRFSTLHERRVDAVEGLFKRLVRMQVASHRLLTTHQTAPEWEELVGAASVAGADLDTFFGEHRIYFPVVVLQGFGDISATHRDTWATLILDLARRRDDDRVPPHEIQRRLEAWERAVHDVTVRLPKMMADIEINMRAVLDPAEIVSWMAPAQLPVPADGEFGDS